MTHFTRRKFVATTALAGASLPFSGSIFGAAHAAGGYVRPNVYSAKGQEMLKLYEKAVGVMKGRKEGDPTSYNFQWYTHWVPGKASDNVTKDKIIATLPPAQRPAAQAMWNTCQGHGAEAKKTIFYFLPWHRMELYYFEEIVRAASGEPSFAMPYWNYLESEKEGVLPEPFRDPKSPLYNPNRRPPGHPGKGVNNGERVPDSEVNYECLKLPDYYSTEAVPPNFSSSINNNPHGIMHDLIGDPYASNPLDYGMSFIPTAAGDPIFFLHHCNIDRLWASWNAAGNKNPDDDPKWAGKKFTFANAQGTLAEYLVGKYTNTESLGYSYEKLEPVPKGGGQVASLAKAPAPRAAATVGARAGIKLGAKAMVVTLAPPPGHAMLRDAAQGARTYLVIEGLKVARLPGVQYDIYLGAPKGAAGDALKPYYVGTPSFFEAAGMPGMGQDFSFDVSTLADQLKQQGNTAPQVTIVPKGGAPTKGSNPEIGRISLVSQ
jgi:tyrosinase